MYIYMYICNIGLKFFEVTYLLFIINTIFQHLQRYEAKCISYGEFIYFIFIYVALDSLPIVFARRIIDLDLFKVTFYFTTI